MSRRRCEENTTECAGRNRELPSARRNTVGVTAYSGGVNRNETRSASPTTRDTNTSRSAAVANRSPIDCRAASATRFQCRHVDRFSPTTATTRAPIPATSASVRSPAVSSTGSPPPAIPRDHAAASPSRIAPARARHPAVSSARDRTCFSGRVDRVACCRNFTITARDGRRPCSTRYRSISSSVAVLIRVERVENAPSNAVGTPRMSQPGFRSRPRERCSQVTPRVRVSSSANSPSCNSDNATTAACIGRPSTARHFPSSTVCTLFDTTTCVCRCGSPARESK